MSDSEDAVAATAAIIIAVVGNQQVHRRERRFWVRPSLVRGRKKYDTDQFINDLLLDDEDALQLEYRSEMGFQNFFRMKHSEFEKLLQMIGSKIAKIDTTFRQSIPANKRLAVTLRFLATGDSYTSLGYLF